MSEMRVADIVWKYRNAAREGKKTLKIELYRAEQWRCNWNPYRKTMTPRPPLRDREYWHQYYRLRVDGRWLGRPGFKYAFYTLEQAVAIGEKLSREGNRA
ncbi:hypothetical protein [Desulfobulbus elongatus]|uniref:hypothetical protein n=1 Tax=Desulfobulbus elongatus TaxID=53332 RepID=UPI0012FB4308|nr:hypothetical protein [Desulfobulbus elongatus]